MRRGNVLLVLGKEVREALRDRRTLFVTLVLPILLYPALMIGLSVAAARQQSKLQEATQKYAVQGPVPEALGTLLAEARGLVRADPPDAREALKAGEIQLLVRAADDFGEVLAAGGTARLELLHDSANEASAQARRKAAAVVDAWESGILEERLASRGVPREFIDPVEVPPAGASDVATATRRGAHVFGRILSMMLVIMVVTGAFTPAVDAVAGEKERGTMETLLVSPATRLELVLGKFLSVFAVSLATALGNLVSMALTFGYLTSSLGFRNNVDFELGLAAAGTIFVVLVPLAAVFTALALALSTLARSGKEAQTYLTPLMLVAMPLAMVSVVPNVELTFGLASVPVAGSVLLFRDLMLAQGEPVLLGKVLAMVPVVLGSTVLVAGLSLRWAVWMFEREEVLFRDPGEPFSWKDLRPVRRRGSVPGPGAAFFLPAATLAATYFLAQGVLDRSSVGSPWAAALQQGVMLAAVAAGVALAGLDLRATLGLRRAGAAALLGGILLGCGSAAATPWLLRATGLDRGPDAGTGKLIEGLIRGLDFVPLVLLLGVLPAVAEEALFRGWSLRGLRSQMSPLAAVVLSAVLFGAFHLEPERIAFTAALGCGLGYLALRSGSLLPPILAHALHNGITVVLGKTVLEGNDTGLAAALSSGESAAWGAAGLAAAAAGVALVAFAGGSTPDGGGGFPGGGPGPSPLGPASRPLARPQNHPRA